MALLPVTMVAVAVALHRRTPGSRRAAAVLSVVALGEDLSQARERAYAAVEQIDLDGTTVTELPLD